MQVYEQPTQSLGDLFGKLKDKQADSEIKGIVYKFECPDCPFTYIGERKGRGSHGGLSTSQAYDLK